MSAPIPGTFQFVWWWRWSSVWRPARLGRPFPDHGPACAVTGAIYAWYGLKIGPLEIRKWGKKYEGERCTCREVLP